MLGIRNRMAMSFIFIIVLTVLVLEVLIINMVRMNYYNNMEAALHDQLRISCDLYNRYFSDTSLNDNILNNVDSFWKQTNAQVEIIDTAGRVLMDSIGYMPEESERLPDVEQAFKTGKGAWIGKVSYDSNPVMAVSRLIQADGKAAGVLRFISTLKHVDKDISDVSRVFIITGIVVAVISMMLSFLLSNTIVNPLKRVTNLAARMASGDYDIRGEKLYNDEIGRLSDTLNYMAEEIQKKDRLKNEFVSSVSHELRTPLTSIKGWAVTLAETGTEDKELFNTGLDIIEKESDRLAMMVEELLDFSRLISDKITMKKETVKLEEFIDSVGRQLAPRAVREGLVFNVEIEGRLPDLFIDGNRLKQVIINILDNAFRFTESGGSVVFSATASGGEVIFTVKDTGCGIEAGELENVKEKFYRGKNSKSGSGIGLSICDEIVKLMNGSMSIYSAFGKGTRIVIRIPTADKRREGAYDYGQVLRRQRENQGIQR